MYHLLALAHEPVPDFRQGFDVGLFFPARVQLRGLRGDALEAVIDVEHLAPEDWIGVHQVGHRGAAVDDGGMVKGFPCGEISAHLLKGKAGQAAGQVVHDLPGQDVFRPP